MNDLVTIIITTHGGSPKLKRAISSVLSQTYRNIEIIVVDDNSPDSKQRQSTENIMKMYSSNQSLKYIKHSQNKNGAAARNTGLRNASGEFIGFLDDDDFYFPKKVEYSVRALKNNPTCDMVYCGVIHISRFRYDGFQMVNVSENMQRDIMLGDFSIGTGSNLFFTKFATESTGEFDEEFIRYQDIEYVLRLLNNFTAVAVNKPLIVKDSNGRNFPTYKKLYKATMLFLNKFEGLINKFSLEERNRILEHYYSILWECTFLSNDKDDLVAATKDLGKYHTFTSSEMEKMKKYYFISWLSFIKIRLKNNIMADFVKRIIGKNSYKNAIRDLGQEKAIYTIKNMQ